MILEILWLTVGLAVITGGAETLVRGGSSLARHLGMTPLVIGLTVVAMGTSAPEMVVSIGGALSGHHDISVGNVVGSNIFNIGIILALCALLMPIRVQLGLLKLDAPLVTVVTLGVVILIAGGLVSRVAGIVLLLLLVAYTGFSVWLAKKQVRSEIVEEFDQAVPAKTRSLGMDAVLLVAGLGLLVLGSRLLVTSAVGLATRLGVDDAVIGLTIVAAGTSMPELATSVVAALRRQSDIAIGNVLGSNLFNMLGILGLSAVVSPLTTTGMLRVDLLAMLGLTVLMLPLLWTGRKLQRWEGGLLLAGYAIYLWLRWP